MLKEWKGCSMMNIRHFLTVMTKTPMRTAYEYTEDNAGGIFEADRAGVGIGVLVSDGLLL